MPLDENEMTMGLEPFDPAKHKPVDIGKGGPSTELTITVDGPDGRVWNIPSLWWTKDGKPMELPENEAIKMAVEHERLTGARFPRFSDIPTAVEAAQARSKKGGAAQGRLAY